MTSRSRTPRVTVGVPVYNGDIYFAQTLDSLLAQTFDDFELIISDNASTDRTGEIALDYAARDRRIRYVRNDRNIGQPRNARQTVAMARGVYFRWAAADDISLPTLLERCVEVLDRDPGTVLVYPKTRNIDAEGKLAGDYDDNLHLQSHHPSVRFRHLLDRLGYCNAMFGVTRTLAQHRTRPYGTYPGSDIVMLAELSLNGRFWEVPEYLFHRRFHDRASSSMTPAQRLKFYNPMRSSEIYLRHWRHLYELTRGVLYAPIALREKRAALQYLARSALWDRDAYARDVTRAVKVISGRLVGRASR